MLDFVVERIAERFFMYHDRLDALLRVETPGRAEVKRLQDEFPNNNVMLGYFFERAGSEWLVPLKKSSLFKYPPPPVVEDDRTVGFPPWTASRYLVRMATIPSAEKEVVDLAFRIPATDNTRIHEDLAEVACAVAPRLAADFVERAIGWLDSPFKILLPEKLGRLARRLASGAEGEKAIQMARALFKVFPDPRFEGISPEQRQRLLLPDPRGHMDDYEYEQILSDCRDDLIRAAPEQALDTFSDLLAEAVNFSFPDREPPEDHSGCWRPAIFTGGSRRGGDLKDSLTTTTCEAARAAVEADPSRLEEIVNRLEARRSRVFLRVALWLADQFPGDVTDRIRNRLIEEHGRIEPPPSHESHTGVFYGHRSPRNADELRAMDTSELVEFLKTWKPQNDWDEPSTEGLSDHLRIAVANDFGRYSAEARTFIGVPVQHVAAVLGAFESVVKENKGAVVWEAVLNLCRWVVEQRDTPESEEERGWVRWRHARCGVVRLLREGFGDGPAELGEHLHDDVWELLEILSRDPDPTAEEERRLRSEDADPVQLSISTVRAEVVNTLPAYAGWRVRLIERRGDSVPSPPLTALPELREVLDRLAGETSFAVRSACGQRFGFFVWLDNEWAERMGSLLFSRDVSRTPYGEVAWEGFVVTTSPHPAVFGVLRDHYRTAVELLGTAPRPGRRFGEPDKHLAEHLVELYWQGHIELVAADSLLSRFYVKASPGLRKHVMEFVGRRLRNTEGDVPAEILQRLQDLFEWRFEAARESADLEAFADELSWFGCWFSSGKFDAAWALGQLSRTLDSVGEATPAHFVAERLEVLAPSFPREAVRCLAGLVDAVSARRFIGWRDHGRRVLEVAIASGDEAARTDARKVANKFGALGYEDFRDLGT